jgi:hypothetical protein
MAIKLQFLDKDNKLVYDLDWDPTPNLLEYGSSVLSPKPIKDINTIIVLEAESAVALKLYSSSYDSIHFSS